MFPECQEILTGMSVDNETSLFLLARLSADYVDGMAQTEEISSKR